MTKSLAQVMREALEKYGLISTRELAEKPEFANWPHKRIRQTRNNVLSQESKSRWAKNNPEKRMCAKIRNRCKKTNIYFGITPEDLKIPDNCPVLGIPLDSSTEANRPSVDRFDATCGYTPENISVISYRANVLKNNATLEEIEKLYNWMKAETESRGRR
ncbi:MAG: hypothetical protein CL490_16290 [Acinetobacter sp.]|nr:hypothetical protein [Acinetobacter sp.]|tara:strand:- start:5997 stop:6476 length:480 start_codon:yes stop_codon:yes gene_type:complete